MKTLKKEDDFFKNKNKRFSPDRDENNTLSFILSSLNMSEEMAIKHQQRLSVERNNFSNQKTRRNFNDEPSFFFFFENN